jgi:hypothetical protein
LPAARPVLLLGAAICAAAFAGSLQAQPPSLPPPREAPTTVPRADSPEGPDDDFLEFLGADDVGDAAWWDFFKKAPPHGATPPAAPPQDAKQ